MSIPLDDSPAEIVRQLLIDLGVGVGLAADGYTPLGAWPVYTDVEPTTPDNALTVYDTTPRSRARSMIDGEQVMGWGVQVRVRATDKPTGRDKAEAVRIAFNETVYHNAVYYNSHVYVVYTASRTNLLRLGLDGSASKRFLHTVNTEVTLREIA